MANQKKRVRNGVTERRCAASEHAGKRWLPLTEFQADASRTDGLRDYCRTCINGRQRAYDAAHADEGSQRSRGTRRRNTAKADLRAIAMVEVAEREAAAIARDRGIEREAKADWTANHAPSDRVIANGREYRKITGGHYGTPNRPIEDLDRIAASVRRAVDTVKPDDVSTARYAGDEYEAISDKKAHRLAEIAERAARERAERLASDTAPLRPEDFDEDDDVGVANDPRGGRLSAQASREKRQEYSRAMGQHAHHVRAAAAAELRGDGDLIDSMPPEAGSYIGKLAEQEARFGRRRLARSLSLFAAGEEQARRLWAQACRQYLTGRVVPTGYAAKPSSKPIKRSVCLLLSDLHIGADLKHSDNPHPYGAVEEARRLEYVLRQALDYKPQYRADSEFVLLVNGDLVDGLLLHDFRDGAPLIEQKAAAQVYFERLIGELARAYPSGRVVWRPGNHGRDKVRHPGRATSSKWDGHEWGLGYSVMRACSELKNVRWDLGFRAVGIVDLYGAKLGLTHGDTEVKIGDPDTKARENAQALAEINSSNIYGVQFDAWCFGHFHKPRQHPRQIRTLFNGALIPPNGHARSNGWIGETCGQWLFESVPGYPIGDTRFIEVGPAQDRDERLGQLITPFRFDLDADGRFPT